MGRTIVGFFLAFVLGFVGLQLALRALVYYIDGPEADAAAGRDVTVADYRAWAASKYERPFGRVSFVGALLCGALGAVGFNRPIVRARCRFRAPCAGPDEPLSRGEFHQVLQACIWVPIDERCPEYVRGLAVGRLAENQPGLAKKIDDFSERHMASLHQDLCRRRARGT
jgi:hypothetical protein